MRSGSASWSWTSDALDWTHRTGPNEDTNGTTNGTPDRPPNGTPTRRSSAMPIVTVQQGPRDPELKRELVRRVTDAFVDAYKIPAETVQVWIHEVPADSWGAAGTLTADK
ncbi:4-oxalocrotonate tautomerase DmpI [Streptomyces sp. NPDC001980]|uniref:4-oxalocrotonate tautomerase DmpI n=2 Tax=Streptomyces TaxID=1883 RepID=UPI003318EA27